MIRKSIFMVKNLLRHEVQPHAHLSFMSASQIDQNSNGQNQREKGMIPPRQPASVCDPENQESSSIRSS